MNLYTKKQWEADGTLSVQIGQTIDNEVYNDLFECLPPKTMTANLFQVGEPYNHDYLGNALYATFVNNGTGWVFVGHCRKGETVQRIGMGDVEARRVLAMEFEGIDNFNRPVFKCLHIGSGLWRFGCTDILFSTDTPEKEVKAEFIRRENSLRSLFYYFGNKFGCEPSGDPLYDGDKVVIYWSDLDMFF